MYNNLVPKVNNIGTSRFVLKTKYDDNILDPEKENYCCRQKIPDASWIVKKADYNTKITERESKVPNISRLATTAALVAAENKIPDVSSLVKERLQHKN